MVKKKKYFNDLQDAENEMKRNYKQKKQKAQYIDLFEDVDDLDYNLYRFLKETNYE